MFIQNICARVFLSSVETRWLLCAATNSQSILWIYVVYMCSGDKINLCCSVDPVYLHFPGHKTWHWRKQPPACWLPYYGVQFVDCVLSFQQ
jgi:hypothetical protein